MRFLIVGGAGFMGCNYVRFLLDSYSDAEVIVFDKFVYSGRMENLHDVMDNPRLTVIRGDVCDEVHLEEVVRKYEPDVIVNFSAETHVDRSISEPAPFLRTNIFGVFSLLEVCRRTDVPKIIHISTDEVYGDLEEGLCADEDYPFRPGNPYSASKASGDLLVQSYRRTYGIPSIIVRPSNNYGPYQYPEKFIPKTIIRALNDMHIPIYGSGNQIRDWLYVGDFVRALDIIIRKGLVGHAYNVPGFNPKRNVEVVECILRFLGKPLNLIKFVDDRPGHDARYCMRGERIMELGWKPLVSWDEGIKNTIEWYVKNKWWWEPVLSDKFFKSDTPWRS